MSAGGAAAGQKPPMGSPMGGTSNLPGTTTPNFLFGGNSINPPAPPTPFGGGQATPLRMPQYGGPQFGSGDMAPSMGSTEESLPPQYRNPQPQYVGTGQATTGGMSPFNTQGPDIQRLLQQYQKQQGGQGGKGGMPAKRGFGGQEPRVMGGMLGGGMRGQENYGQQPARGGLEALLGNMAGKKSSTNSLQ